MVLTGRIFKKGKFIIAKDRNNKILEKTAYEKGKTLKYYKAIFKKNGTFLPDTKKETVKFKTSIGYYYTSTKKIPKRPKVLSRSSANKFPRLNFAIYGYLGRKRIGAGSGFLPNLKPQTIKEAQEMTLQKFYENLAYYHSGEYDANEGMRIAKKYKVKINYQWVSYANIKKQKRKAHR